MYSPELNSIRMSLEWVRIEESIGSIWFEKTQQKKGDSLTKGHMSELWEFTHISVTQNNLQELKELLTFGKVDLVPTVEEYTTLLCCLRIQAEKAYSRAANIPTFLKKLINLILLHPDMKKRVDIVTLSIYGLVIFPKALGHIDEAVSDLFD
ncbi:hypothetical protein Goklo_011996 [Gossypium klotzschianum]|uniref:Uncharacterized protein n=1 Tax=Gossypium klotzschianum TaxID=34286 RepID=A0A7J8VAT2_9ROSI|nr:hypothetical protein [Gossypium klotzschianum]